MVALVTGGLSFVGGLGLVVARLWMSDDELTKRVADQIRDDLSDERDYYKDLVDEMRPKLESLRQRVTDLEGFIDEHPGVEASSDEIGHE